MLARAVSRPLRLHSEIGGIPYWPVDTVLSVEELDECVTRLERIYSRKAEDRLYARLLRACGNSRALDPGRRLHRHVQVYADDRNLFMGNRLVTMYRRCCSVGEAKGTFDRMRERDVVTWTVMISAYAENGHQAEALELYRAMLKLQEPNKVTFLAVLNACDSPELLDEGIRLHRQVGEMGFESDVKVGNALVNMYSRCESLQGAMQVFERMRDKDLISWNSAIAANAQPGGDHRLALRLLKRMMLEGVVADQVTFISALNACTGAHSLRDGRLIHEMAILIQVENDVVVGTALVTMYGRCGSLQEACALFQRMPNRNVVSWNAMMATYVQFGRLNEALQLYQQMPRAGVESTKVTYVTVLNAIDSPKALTEGKRIHSRIEEAGLDKATAVCNALVAMYGRCGSLEDARNVFDSMHGFTDLVSWNSLISAYLLSEDAGDWREAIVLFQRMRSEKVAPSRITFLTVLSACSELRDLQAGRSIYTFSKECGFGSSIDVLNAAMHLYVSCGCLEEAVKIFDGMALTGRDTISWNTLITGTAQQRSKREAAALLFRRMQLDGIRSNQVTFMSVLSSCDSPPALEKTGKFVHWCVKEQQLDSDPDVAAAVINMYGKCREVTQARQLFEELENKILISWNSMMSAYASQGCAREAFELFERMQRRGGVAADRVTFINLLNACIVGGSLLEGRMIHERIVERGLDSDPVVTNTLVNMYAKCGSLQTAFAVFDKIPVKDLVSWNGMIAAVARSGLAEEVLRLFWLMQQDGVRPDGITLMSTLSACSHAGMVGRGGDDFVAMVVDYEIEREVEHYGCMVDLLARAGRVVDAERLARRVPLERKEVSWMSLLAACEVQGDEKRAKRVAGSIVELNPGSSSAYVALSNLYATSHGAGESRATASSRIQRGDRLGTRRV